MRKSLASKTQNEPGVELRRERLYYLLIGALALLLASLPYLYGWWITPKGDTYTGFTYNIDDSCVYLAWMRQAQEGHFFQRNLFSTEPQSGLLFNFLFLTLGSIVRFTGLPVMAVYHGARIAGGALTLWAFAALGREALPENARARRIGFALFCFSAGLGWLWGGWSQDRGISQPVDLWQPEAIGFLSLYFSPLFACALACIVLFLKSALRTERTGDFRDAIPAMIAGALLGNFHSYDVIPLFTSWFVYRLIRDLSARRLDRAAWLRFLAVGLVAAPTTLWVFWISRIDPVFYKRAFITGTLSPKLWWDLLGFGLPLVYAAVAVWRERQAGFAPNPRPLPPILGERGEGESEITALVSTPNQNQTTPDPQPTVLDSPSTTFPQDWGKGPGVGGETNLPEKQASANRAMGANAFLLTFLLVGIAVAYFPVAFQRKLLMGAAVPLCVLAGAGLAALTANLSGDFPKIAAFFGVLLTMPSNVLFLLRDSERLSINASSTSNQPYLKSTEIAAIDFLRDHTAPGSIVLVSPDASSQTRPPGWAIMPYLSVYVPAYTGRTAYIGHWGETVAYKDKMSEMHRFFRSDTPETAADADAFRQSVLNAGRISYILYDNRLAAGPITDATGKPILKPDGSPVYAGVDWLHDPPPYLQTVFQNTDVTIYAAHSAAATPTLSAP